MEIKKPKVRIVKYDDIKRYKELRSDPDIATMLGGATPAEDKYYNQKQTLVINTHYNKVSNTMTVIINIDKRRIHSLVDKMQPNRSLSICSEITGFPALQQYLISNNRDIYYALYQMDKFWYALFDGIIHYCSICQSLSGIKDNDLDIAINSHKCRAGIKAIIVDLLRYILPIFFQPFEESKRESWESKPMVISYNNVSDGEDNSYMTNSVKEGEYVCNENECNESVLLMRYFYHFECVIGLIDISNRFADPVECFTQHLAELGLQQFIKTLVEYGCEIDFPDRYVTGVMRTEYHRRMHKHTDALYQIYHETKHVETSFVFEIE